MNTLTIFPIGSVQREQHKTFLQIKKLYIPALKHIEKFSHIHVLWWCNEFEAQEYRIVTQNQPPYHGAPLSGVFASRSPVRPNPIALTTVPILHIDQQQGLIEITNIDAYHQASIIDLKAHFPIEDRVKNVRVPPWMIRWPEWLSDESSCLQAPEQTRVSEKPAPEQFDLIPIGVIRKKCGTTVLQIEPACIPALKQIEHFSHIRIFWWFHRFQDDRFRKITQCHPPYQNAPRTGVFASRSPVRPNPIGFTVAKVLEVNQAQGTIEIAGIDAYEHTPLIDIKPYIPCCDRVNTFRVPEWVRHWPEWMPEADEIEVVTPDRLCPSDNERLAALIPSPERSIESVPAAEIFEAQTFQAFSPHESFANTLVIRGARQHNLKHLDITIPHNSLTVVTGVSGSGKSSLVFDTIHAEGQRRYMDSLSPLARQFLDQMEKPQVDQITGLHPTVAIEQKTLSRNPRSTVGTVTEIYDYLRVLFARLGTRHCPQCGRAITPQTAVQMANQLISLGAGTRFRIANNTLIAPETETNEFRQQLFETIEKTLKAGNGVLRVVLEEGEEFVLNEYNACAYCNRVFFDLHPTLFSYNSPEGMCPECHGLGVKLSVDPEAIIANPHVSLLDGASPWYGDLRQYRQKPTANWMRNEVFALAEQWQIDLELPWKALPAAFQNAVLYGAGDEMFRFSYHSEKRGRSGEIERPVQGAVNHITRLFLESKGGTEGYLRFMREQSCPVCQGEKLCAEARFVTLGGTRYPEVASMNLTQAQQWISSLPERLEPTQASIAHAMLATVQNRLHSLLQVGLQYLTLDRPAPTLSGGEGQRLRLATRLGCGLSGLFYVLDEPSIGLHPRDHQALLAIMRQLQEAGNTVLVVEHDADTMRAADWLIDLGPGAGILGGELVAAGTPQAVMAAPNSLTGQYLCGALQVFSSNGVMRRTAQKWLRVINARLHNLKNLDVCFPLGCITCVTGVSGSGKSSLVAQTLAPALAQSRNGAQGAPGPYDCIEGLEHLDKVITITQTPIGRTPRSNPATYIGVFDEIRKVFASTPAAKARGYQAGHFSFNAKGGRCEACRGEGRKRIEMHFLPDVWVVCSECQGQRFQQDTLEITYRGRSVAEVLAMDVQEALDLFRDHPKIMRMLRTLQDVGLDYIKLGQSALTLSGGEAQRIQLARELSRTETGRTVYILDEPTTGLHFADIQKLLDVLQRLTDAGNTVIMIEHNLDVINAADWVIDLGPEGGEAGGEIVAEGTPEQVAQIPASCTGRFLQQVVRKPII